MRKLKKGDVYPCMGAVKGNSLIDFKFNDDNGAYTNTFEEFWQMCTSRYNVVNQFGRTFDLYMETNDDLFIGDLRNEWTKVKKITRVQTNEWIRILFE